MRQLAFAAAVAAAAAAVPAFGQALFQTDVDASDVRAVPIERPAPNFPGGVRTGQEGWVRVNFVVTPDGRATDPIVVEAAGGAPFEHAVREMLDRWRFEPPGAHEIGNNVIDAYFEIDRGRDAASANFIRRSRRIVRHVYDEEAGPAREQLDAAVELGGWNLYESTMLNLMAGRVAALEGDDFGKLEHYRRAFAMNVRNSVSGEDRRDLLARIFEVEYAKSQYSAAAATAAALAAEPGGEAHLEDFAGELKALEKTLTGPGDLVAAARIGSACDCDAGEPLWRYRPTRETFAFERIEGALGRYELRCDATRASGDVRPGETYSVPANGTDCRLFVFGEAGTTFELRESGEPREDAEALLPVEIAGLQERPSGRE